MPDISLSPLPYNGGTFNLRYSDRHHCYLGDGKFASVITQNNPFYAFLYSSQVTNIKTGTSAASIRASRAFDSASGMLNLTNTSGQYSRLAKLTQDRVMLIQGNGGSASRCTVFDIGAGGDFTKKNASLNDFFPFALGGSPGGNSAIVGAFYGGGNRGGVQFHYFNARDNVIYVVQKNASGNVNGLYKIVYDPVGDTLTQSRIGSFDLGVGAGFPIKAWLTAIPGQATKKLLQVRESSSNYELGQNTATVRWAYIVDTADDTFQAISPMPVDGQGLRLLCPLSLTRIIGFRSDAVCRVWNGTTWGADVTFNANTIGANYTPYIAEPLDANYMMLITVGWTVGMDMAIAAIGSQEMYVRIVRYVDDTLLQTSPNTQANAGLALSTAVRALGAMQWDNDFYARDANDNVLLFGYGNGTGLPPNITSIYQPAA